MTKFLMTCFAGMFGLAFTLTIISSTSSSPNYKVGECYQQSGDWEKWETPTVINIKDVGVHKYLYYKTWGSPNADYTDPFHYVETEYDTKVECSK